MAGERVSGVCRVCGCTETTPCAIEIEGQQAACWWIDAARTLCSSPSCLALVPLEQIEREMEGIER